MRHKSHAFVVPQEARHPRRRSGISLPECARASAARGLLPHQPAAGGRAWAEAHCERLACDRAAPACYVSVDGTTSAELHTLRVFQAFPAISTGIYGYPIESATRVALGEIRKFLDTDDAKEAGVVQVTMLRNSVRVADHMGVLLQFDRIIFVVFSSEDEAVYLCVILFFFEFATLNTRIHLIGDSSLSSSRGVRQPHFHLTRQHKAVERSTGNPMPKGKQGPGLMRPCVNRVDGNAVLSCAM